MIFVYIVLAVVVLWLVSSAVVFVLAFYSPLTKAQYDAHEVPKGAGYDVYNARMHQMIDELTSYKSETVAIPSYDGLVLTGKYIHVADGAPLDIMVHGYRGLAVRDFSGGAVARIKSGHNVLLVEQRAHEHSGGHIITFGIRERYDIMHWINYAVGRFGSDVKIVLFGVSMGAASVLMTSDLDLPTQVKAICADCPYSSPSDILKNTVRGLKLPTFLCMPLLWTGALLWGHFNLYSASAVKSVANSSVPILIMHGMSDTFVPCKMSEKIAAANPDKVELHLWSGAVHGMSFVVHTDEYMAVEKAFLDKVL